MARKRSGYEVVIEFFTSAEPALAMHAMVAAQAIIRGRNLVAAKPPRKKATLNRTVTPPAKGPEVK
jgi:hypothetical protein